MSLWDYKEGGFFLPSTTSWMDDSCHTTLYSGRTPTFHSRVPITLILLLSAYLLILLLASRSSCSTGKDFPFGPCYRYFLLTVSGFLGQDWICLFWLSGQPFADCDHSFTLTALSLVFTVTFKYTCY